MGLRYTGECLCDPELVGESVNIEYDIRDIRELAVSTVNGDVLGKARAPRSWQNYPVSTQTKTRIAKETKKKRLKAIDPMSGYFDFLLANKDFPKTATEIVRLYRETNEGKAVVSANDEFNISESKVLHKVKASVTNIPKWSTEVTRRK